jgi:hypothetical protein
MSQATLQSSLIIEPDESVIAPYHLIKIARQRRVKSLDVAAQILSKPEELPDIIFLSADFSAAQCVEFLEFVKERITHKLIPLCIVINLRYPVSYVPGTTWAGKFGVIHTLTSPDEYQATLDRIMHHGHYTDSTSGLPE